MTEELDIYDGAWSEQDIDKAEKKARFTIIKDREHCQGRLYIKISKEVDSTIPDELKFDHGFNGGDYCLSSNKVECDLLGASPDYWEHCTDWYIVVVE